MTCGFHAQRVLVIQVYRADDYRLKAGDSFNARSSTSGIRIVLRQS